MANVTGKNQLAPHGYGDEQAQKGLLREAPISGATTTASALNAPQRSQRRATRGAGAAPSQEAPAPPPPLNPTDPAQVVGVWQTLASHPQASPLVRQYAERAQGATSL